MKDMCEHTFSRIIDNPNPEFNLSSLVDDLQEQNGGLLDIDCYCMVGPDGSSGSVPSLLELKVAELKCNFLLINSCGDSNLMT